MSEADTAHALGSGSLPVLATPRLLAWCEEATCAAVEDALPPGSTTVGMRVELEHLAPSGVGEQVTVRAELTGVDGRRLSFAVQAGAEADPIGSAAIVRAMVDADRFVSRMDQMRR